MRTERLLPIEELTRVLAPEGLLVLCQPEREGLDLDERTAWRTLKAKLRSARFEIVDERYDRYALVVANAGRTARVTELRQLRPAPRARPSSYVRELRAAYPRRAQRQIVVPHRS
jgi:hypothetical protein